MIATTRATVHAGGVLGALHCEPPLTLRRIRADDPDECALCLVGTAAGPLSGDRLRLELDIDPGARASLLATGASIAQGRAGAAPAEIHLQVRLGAGAGLVADPGPLIVSHGSRVDVHLDLSLGAGACLDWRELVVLGRTGEPAGQARIRWDVTRAGRPVLRQSVDLAEPALVGHRVLATALLVDPQRRASTVVRSPTAVAQVLADGSLLATVLGQDAAAVAAELTALCAFVNY